MVKKTYSLKGPEESNKLLGFLQCSPEAELVLYNFRLDKYYYHFSDATLALGGGSSLTSRRITFFGDNLEKITKAKSKTEVGAEVKLEES